MGRKKKAESEKSPGSNSSSKQRASDERVREFLYLYSRESPYIRNCIARDLPAYNNLLSLNASSFEEIALQQIALQKGLSYGYKEVLPSCPHCASENVGRKTDANTKKENMYRCYACGQTYSANFRSISSGTKCSALTWMKLLQCLLNFMSIAKTCEFCGISEMTYYNLRNRIFYAMQLLLDRIKLYGNIEVDNTFVRVSYKGVNLQESDFPEESIFFDPTFKPRSAMQRGEPTEELNSNKICIFTAITDHGHVLARFAGVGAVNYRTLQSYIPANKFLSEVPEEDPFRGFLKPQNREPVSCVGDRSLLIADKEGAIRKYAENVLHMDIEAHVYRRYGVQLRSRGYNIQRVNALHRRLKDFLRKCNYVSSKYLPGFLILFEFIENTAASPEAIAEVFRILATPNLGKASSFYQDMYSVPNYLVEFLQSDNPLKKIPYNKLLAFYLYDHIRRRECHPNILVTMEQIEEETAYSATTIRNHYRALCDAGYRDMILAYFGEPTSKRKKDSPIKKEKRANNAPTTFNPTIIAFYDEYAEIRVKPPEQRITLNQLLTIKNEELGTNYTRTNIIDKFKKIEAAGIRPPLPKLASSQLQAGNATFPEKALDILEDYNKIVLSYREKGLQPPKNDTIFATLGEQYNLSQETVGKYVTMARAYRKREKQT